jgi:hypothetical protein
MSNETRVRFKDRTLVDSVFENPIDRFQQRARNRNLTILVIGMIGIIAVVIVRRWLN